MQTVGSEPYSPVLQMMSHKEVQQPTPPSRLYWRTREPEDIGDDGHREIVATEWCGRHNTHRRRSWPAALRVRYAAYDGHDEMVSREQR